MPLPAIALGLWAAAAFTGLIGTWIMSNQLALVNNTLQGPANVDGKITRDYLAVMRRIGGGFLLERGTHTFNQGASPNLQQVAFLDDPGASLATLQSAENTIASVQREVISCEAYNLTKSFQILPVAVLGSPSLATAGPHQSSTVAPHLIMEDRITAGKWGAIYGPLIRSRMIMDNGAARHVARFSMDLTKISKQYCLILNESQLEDESRPLYKIFMIVYSDFSVNTEVNTVRTLFYNLRQRAFGT